MVLTVPTRLHATADVDERATIGDGSSVWHYAQIREGAVLGRDCVIGRGAYVGPGVTLGDACKVQNYGLVYEPAALGTGVFIGPGAVLTNDLYPRAANPDLSVKTGDDWDSVGVTVHDGASIGARAVCVAPVVVGRWALVAAGSVVVDDVPDFALVAGVPAKQLRWVGRAGVPLEPADGQDRAFRCPQTNERYVVGADGILRQETP